jgi:hypothetical protein
MPLPLRYSLKQTESDPVAVLQALGYDVRPYRMSAEEYSRVYRLPVGISGFRCPPGHQRVLAGIRGQRRLRCVV